MTAREKVLDVERQVREIVAGHVQELHCPFCGEVSKPEMDLLCCENAAELVLAITTRIEVGEKLNVLDRVMDRATKAGMN